MPQANSFTSEKHHLSRRRWFQFSVRTLLILTTIIAAWLGWWSYKARQQRGMVNALAQCGAYCEYDFNDGRQDAPPHIPKWLVDVIGVDFFASVTTVGFVNTDFAAVKLPPLIKLPALTDVSFRDTQNADVALEQMAALKCLRLISGDRQVTDAGMVHLRRHTSLTHLFLDGAQISDAGLMQVEKLTAMRWLMLDDTNVTDVGLAHLAGMTSLERLHLNKTHVTDAGLQHLRGLTSLHELTLNGTHIRGPGLKHLQGLSQLQQLDLGSTPLDDDGLQFLHNVLSLRSLGLYHTKVTAAGVARLQRSLPNCNVYVYPPPP